MRQATALLVFDDGPEAGLGHRRRMAALAGALEERGVPSRLAVTDGHAAAELVVVDSYRRRADDQGAFRGDVVAAVDDLQRDLAVDVVVDPSPGRPTGTHRSAGRALAGARYALLPRAGLRTPPVDVTDPVGVAVVTTGGADREGNGAAIAERLARALPAAQVRLVVGPWGSHCVPAGVVAVDRPDGLDQELAAASIVVSAAGVTMLESLRLGRPTVAVVVAENQWRAAEGARRAGAAELASLEDAAGAAEALAADPGRRRSLSHCALQLVDGRGAERVAAELMRALEL